jgi:hypothetical protein
MTKSPDADRAAAVEKAVRLAQQALDLCDEHGLLTAGADLSSAIEKMQQN